MACWEQFSRKRGMAKKMEKQPDVPKEDKLHAEIKATQTIVIN